MPRIPRYSTLALAIWLTGCASVRPVTDDGALQREALAGSEKPAPVPPQVNPDLGTANVQGNSGGQSQISEGTGRFIRPSALSRPRPAVSGEGAVTFNFENQPVQAVVKAILGDLLKKNYTIAPGVQGNISFSTSSPVSNDQALPILETLLSWTDNALVDQGGRYVVMPAKQAVGGNLVPSLGANAPQGGLQARMFALRYISAPEMQKLMKPMARPDSILLADPGRNVLVMSGTPEELENYQRTVNTFDVDWLRGMSIGVFGLQRANVDDVMPQMDKLFGPKGDTPLAGLLRFIPVERTNSLVVISTQPDYLQEVGDWITKIDRGGGNEPQLYVYNVRNIQATDLATYLGNIYGGNASGGDNGGKVGPGLNSNSLSGGSASGLGSNGGSFGSNSSNSGGAFGGSSGLNGSSNSSFGGSSLGGGSSSFGGSSLGGGSSSFGGSSSGGSSFGSSGGAFGSSSGSSSGGGFGSNRSNGNGSGNGNGNGGDTSATLDNGVRIASASGGNQLLVRARPSQWSEIEAAIEKLDVAPLQVHIDAKILEVELQNQFQFGVQWWLAGLADSTGQSHNTTQGQLGGANNTGTTFTPFSGSGGAANASGDTFYYSYTARNFKVAISALEASGYTKTLSEPSIVIANNQVAHFSVGQQIPINSTSLSGVVGVGATDGTVNSASYINTGVILDVQPRVNPGGLVYMDVHQQVSNAVNGSLNQQGNPTISSREIATQVAVQSGQTVLMGGMITQSDSKSDSGLPWLNDVPVLGRLFGTTGKSRDRDELIVLITPTVISNPQEAKDVLNEYQNKFESLTPLRPSATPATTTTFQRY